MPAGKHPLPQCLQAHWNPSIQECHARVHLPCIQIYSAATLSGASPGQPLHSDLLPGPLAGAVPAGWPETSHQQPALRSPGRTVQPLPGLLHAWQTPAPSANKVPRPA